MRAVAGLGSPIELSSSGPGSRQSLPEASDVAAAALSRCDRIAGPTVRIHFPPAESAAVKAFGNPDAVEDYAMAPAHELSIGEQVAWDCQDPDHTEDRTASSSRSRATPTDRRSASIALETDAATMTAQPISDGDHVLDEKTAWIGRRLIDTVKLALGVPRVTQIPMPLREALVRGFAAGLRVEHILRD
jgi:hypothetical protein